MKSDIGMWIMQLNDLYTFSKYIIYKDLKRKEVKKLRKKLKKIIKKLSDYEV